MVQVPQQRACVFDDLLAVLIPDPDHSVAERDASCRASAIVIGCWLLPMWHGRRVLAQSLQGGPPWRSGEHMRSAKRRRDADRDTMGAEYDFAKGERGVTAARYAQGTNVIVVDPDVLDVFPEGASVHEALRALAPVIRQRRGWHPSGCSGLPEALAAADRSCETARYEHSRSSDRAVGWHQGDRPGGGERSDVTTRARGKCAERRLTTRGTCTSDPTQDRPCIAAGVHAVSIWVRGARHFTSSAFPVCFSNPGNWSQDVFVEELD
jgi:hypothetical protein